jgi:hypothetical protein
MNIWEEIKKLNGQTLKTLDRQKPFNILAVTDHVVLICPEETQTERPISRDEIEKAYRYLVTIGETTRTEIREKFSEYNPAYVAAILASLPNVEHSTRPIRLWMTGKI